MGVVIKHALHPETRALLTLRLERLAGARRCSPHTLLAYRQDLEGFCAFMNEACRRSLPPALLFEAEIKTYRAWLASMLHLSPATVSRRLSAVRSWAKELIREKVIAGSLVLEVRFPKKPRLLPKPVERDAFVTMVEGWRSVFPEDDVPEIKRDLMLLTLLYGTGLRISEALALTVSDVADKDALYVLGKGGKGRRVPLIPALQDMLQDYLCDASFGFSKRHRSGACPLFLGKRGGMLHSSLFRTRMAKARRYLDLPEHMSPHSLRHTYAGELLAADESKIKIVQELLGHSRLSVTQIYTKVTPDAAARACIACHPRNAAMLISASDPAE